MGGAHISDAEIKKLHQPKGGASEKGCLTRHQKRSEGHQCSHQWQARVKAEENPEMYNYKAYQSLCGPGRFKTAARKTENGVFPWGYAFKWKDGYWKTKPTHEGKEWDIGGDEGDNFNHFLKPYWHNAHHIVPNGALKASINKTGKTDSRLPNLIKQGLLRGNYNLNHKINMVILPQGQNVARALGLPRHLKGDKSGPNEKAEFFSHRDYSDRVELKVDGIMMDYEELFADYLLEDHPPPPDKLSKAKLDNLAKGIFSKIKGLAKKHGGKALSQIPSLV